MERKQTRFVNPNVDHTTQKLTEVTLPSGKKKPRIGLTFITPDDYCLNCLHKKQTKGHYAPTLFDELQSFIDGFRKIDSVSNAITRYISHIKGKNSDKASVEMIKALNAKFDLQIDSIIHLHSKAGGKGEFVIHGFLEDDTFEILWLDPHHEKLK